MENAPCLPFVRRPSTTLEEHNNVMTITCNFGFMYWRKTSVRKIPWILISAFKISAFFLISAFKMFSVHTKMKSWRYVINFFSFEERFRKPPFSWRISVDGRPNRGNKAFVAPASSPGAGWRCYPRFSLRTLAATEVTESSHNLVYRDVVMVLMPWESIAALHNV